ncbi:MAG: glycoside hydrolase family 32 protein [Ruminiclostridium sp.]|nr:glycoside hydrolase family 32 protein [Ruminiclostridium sp.]
MTNKLLFARSYEKDAGDKVKAEKRPKFHLSPYVGWTNDPNGFSYYKGEYHLFYQYNPYSTSWDSMHWGHAVSKDLLHWKYLPASLAPDKDYDSFGCFSGSALELPDGRQLLIYTGVRKEEGDNGKDIQTQCLAVGDGLDYEKYENNPVLDEKDLPEGKSCNNFRDPKMWRDEDGSYKCVVGTCDGEGKGSILLYRSDDGFKWEFESTIIENDGTFGMMWECPDFFTLDGKQVLIVSPQDMLPQGFEYHNGNGTLCLIGSYDRETKKFSYDHSQSIDYGIDFYAPQTLVTPDGRRVMIGWMQNWDTCSLIDNRSEMAWFGQMSIPREISIRNGRLYQAPIREFDELRCNGIEYKSVYVDGDLTLDGIEGRVADIELSVRPKDINNVYHKFAIRFAQNEKFRTSLSFRPKESVLKIDRKFSGSRRAYIHQRRCLVPSENGEIKLRIILDRFSVEVFVNDGEQTMTATFLTDISADRISFFSQGEAVVDITKYDIREE